MELLVAARQARTINNSRPERSIQLAADEAGLSCPVTGHRAFKNVRFHVEINPVDEIGCPCSRRAVYSGPFRMRFVR
jgi:hypothetical protein